MKKEEKYTGLEIAVIGLAGRFPGSSDIDGFWNNLKNGIDSISTITDEELRNEGVPEALISSPEYVKSNAYLEDKSYFDAAFFGYRPDEAELMEPQLRVYQECCWEALEDSGYCADREKIKVGVFASGSINVPWVLHAEAHNKEGLVDNFTASHLRDISFLCSRISYKFNLKGPAVFLNTACSSSLVSIHEACNSILLGECDIALAGGVNIKNYTKRGYLYKEGMIHSKDGKCRPFDSASSGTVGGEGAGVVVLKRLKNALKDNDNIYAVVKGTAINNDGAGKVGFTAPSVKGQIEVIKKAHRIARVKPETITYVETHGTGTALGDPIEVKALNSVFGNSKDKSCALGAVKSNIGHLDAAAGVAGFIKTVLSIKNKLIPPSTYFNTPNPKVNFESGPFYINNRPESWILDKKPLRAGVSAFGIGGTNAHVVLEQAPDRIVSSKSRKYQIFQYSAKTQTSLEGIRKKMIAYLERHEPLNFADVCYSLNKGRNIFKYREMLVCETREEALKMLLSQDTIAQSSSTQEELQNVIFMFSGQGSQYINMCKDLYLSEETFKETLEVCFSLLNTMSGKDFYPILFPSEEKNKDAQTLLQNTENTQPILFATQYALATLLMKWGITPDYMIGHSIGEYTAACISGVLSLEDALKLVLKRGVLMSLAEKGTMLSIAIREDKIQPYLAKCPEIDLSVINSNTSVVVSGTDEEITLFETLMKSEGYSCKKVKTSHAFHSRMMDTILGKFEQEVNSVTLKEPKIPYISNVTGEEVLYSEIRKPSYWVQHLRQTVNFQKGTQTLLDKGAACFIEIGPGRTLCNYVNGNESKKEGHYAINMVRPYKQNTNDQKYLSERVGRLYLRGIKIDWEQYYFNEQRAIVTLPTYSFDKIQYTTNFNLDSLLKGTLYLNKGSESVQNTIPENYVHCTEWKRTLSPGQNLIVQNEKSGFLIFSGKESFSQGLISKLAEQQHEIVHVRPGAKFKEVDRHTYEVDLLDETQSKELWKAIQNHKIQIDHIVYSKTLDEHFENIHFDNIDSKLQEGYLGLSFLAKSIAKNKVHQQLNISVFTNNLAKVSEEDTIDPLKATLHGPARIMPSEISNIRCKTIDIPYPFREEKMLNAYLNKSLNEVFYQTDDSFVTYRYLERWVPFFDQTSFDSELSSDAEIVDGGIYIITGGFGGMGFSIAKDIALNRGANIILIHRSDFPKREDWSTWCESHENANETVQKIKAIQKMEAKGRFVELFQLDISNKKGVKDFAAMIHEKYGKINGLIWAAGEVDHGGIIQNRTADDFTKYLKSKVHGLLLFEKYFNLEVMDFLVLFSSIGNAFYHIKFGQVAYNAANEFVENYAHYIKKKLQLPTVVINWCDWLDVGMTVKTNKKNYNTTDINEVNAKIENGITPSEGVDIFYKCLGSAHTVATIYKGNLKKAIASHKEQYLEINSALRENTEVKEKNVGELQIALVDLFNAFFGKEDIQIKDDFFDLGGDSLKAMTLIARINKKLGISLSIGDMYQYPTINALLKKISKEDLSNENVIEMAPELESYPLSYQQQRMYFLQQLHQNSKAYNEPKLYKVFRKYDQEEVQSCFDKIIARHASLRTRFIQENGRTRQIVEKEVPLNIIEFQSGSLEESFEKFSKVFDLGKAPIFRIGIVENNDRTFYLLLDTHHIVTDGTSSGIILKDFIQWYTAEILETNETPGIQYIDYAYWQQSEENQKRIQNQKNYWLEEIPKNPELLALPTDYNRSAEPDFIGDVVSVDVPKEGYGKLLRMTSEEGVSMFTLLIGCFYILLHKLTAQKDLIIGVPTSGRGHAELEHLVGMFVGTLPLRNFIGKEQSFRDLIQIIKTRTLTSFENQDYPFEELINQINVERDSSRNPLFDVMFVYEKTNEDIIDQETLITQIQWEKSTQSRFDLTLRAIETKEGIKLGFVYATQLFKEETVSRFLDFLQNIIYEVSAKPNKKVKDIKVIGEKEIQNMISKHHCDFDALDTTKTILDLFEERVKKSPEAVALTFEKEHLTYKALSEKSDHLASCLRKRGIAHNDLVLIYLDRSIDMIVGVLGILKSGAAYVPIDITYPQERIDFIAKDTGTKLLLSHSSLEPNILNKGDHMILCIDALQKEPYVAFEKNIASDALAYVLYTSGTTGRPKGVMCKHIGLTSLVRNQIDIFGLKSTDTVLQFASIGFDAFGAEVFTTLVSGGRLIMTTDAVIRSKEDFKERILKEKITVLTLPPSYQVVMKDDLESVRILISAGEAMNLNVTKELQAKGITVINAYGPTENTVCATISTSPILTDDRVTIGKVMKGVQAYVLDEMLEIVPYGIIGELCLGGIQVAQGYLNRPKLSGEKFIENPFDKGNTKLYRTGDLVKMLPDGNFIFIGRKDTQVKIRGFRIELGEIENVLANSEEIDQVAVGVREEHGHKHLVAYYVSDKEEVNNEVLKSYLREQLPKYMIPSHYVQVSKIPVTSNGKVDWKTLGKIVLHSSDKYVAPRSQEEKILADIWCEVIGCTKVGIQDNFFALGGDSIKSIQISSKLGNLGYEVSVKDILKNQTIEALAPRICRKEVLEDQTRASGTVPLSPIQKWFFQRNLQNPSHFNQSVLFKIQKGLNQKELTEIFEKILEHHDTLRLRFRNENDSTIQEYATKSSTISIIDYPLKDQKNYIKEINERAEKLQKEISIAEDVLMKVALFTHEVTGNFLLIIINHLIIDGVSWRILFEDFQRLSQQILENDSLTLPPKTASFQRWMEKLEKYTSHQSIDSIMTYWEEAPVAGTARIPKDYPDGMNVHGYAESVSIDFDEVETKKLLTTVNLKYSTRINEILIAAFYMTLRKEYGIDAFHIDIEGHGREHFFESPNISRTLGWFTVMYPLYLHETGEHISDILIAVKEALRRIPNNGFEYLMYRQKNKNKYVPTPQVLFNYLGQFDTGDKTSSLQLVKEYKAKDIGSSEIRSHELELSGIIKENHLEVKLTFGSLQYQEAHIQRLMEGYKKCIREILDFGTSFSAMELTPTDLSYTALPLPILKKLQSKMEIEDICLLSPLQEGLLFHTMFKPDSDVYFEQLSCRIKGELDIEMFKKSFGLMSKRHAVLRTLFLSEMTSDAIQVVLKEREVAFTYLDLREESQASSVEDRLKVHKAKDRSRKFQLDKDKLLRIYLFQVGEKEYEILWSYHHILMDGWSMSILINEFFTIYGNLMGKLKTNLPVVRPYAHYLQWLQNIDKQESLLFWENHLKDYELACEFPKKSLELHAKSQRNNMSFSLGIEHSNKLKTLCAGFGLTENTFVQTIWGVLLAKYNNATDAVYGSVVSGRPGTLDGVEHMVGLFINTVPVRVTFENNDSFKEVLHKVHAASLDAMEHQYVQLAEIQAKSSLGTLLFDHILVFENYPINEALNNQLMEATGLAVETVKVVEKTNYDLVLTILPGEDMKFIFEYGQKIYDEDIIVNLKVHFLKIIAQFLENPELSLGEIDIVDHGSRKKILENFNSPINAHPEEGTIIELFERQAKHTPDAVAITCDTISFTYKELYDRVLQTASYLHQEVKISKKSVVGLYMDRSLESVVAMFSILKIGAIYVPLDIDYSEERIHGILEDANANFVITQGVNPFKTNTESRTIVDISSIGTTPSENDIGEFSVCLEDDAYIIYTSGSTGRPKGIVQCHEALVDYCLTFKKHFSLLSKDTIVQQAKLTFDTSIEEIFPILITGGHLVVISGNHFDLEKITENIRLHKATIISTTPLILKELNAVSKDIPSLRLIISGGDVLLPKHIDHLIKTAEVYNTYGPSETTICATYHKVQELQYASIIGKPIKNKNIYILDNTEHLTPIGVVGELCIAGKGVAKAYLNNPELSALKFKDDPIVPGRTIYKTGDMARWLPDGNIQFLGRKDTQIKIRGHRVELGEIEAQLLFQKTIIEALVLPKESGENKYLIGYFTSSTSLDTEDLKKQLRRQLPEYMIPRYLVQLANFPMMPNGKIARKSLPEPVHKIEGDFLAPSTPMEVELVKIWAKLLEIDENSISIRRSFFELGGHSISIVKLTKEIKKALGHAVSVANAFRYPTIGTMANFIANGDENMEGLINSIEDSQREVEENLDIMKNIFE
ncbi:type I polyketide synthase [Spongiimicrobium salis]|uniref:type I polyketide synthase n=1 Tax=Spongiimicrobium salis TaxID=1667022 RepID=UPI00374D7D63